MAWTDRMVDELKSLWQTGLTTSEIAKKLGVSKNSIVGKVHRLSLSGRPSPIKKKEAPSPKNNHEKQVKNTSENKKEEVRATIITEKTAIVEQKKDEKIATTIEIQTATPEKSDGLVRLTDLDNHTCRWPIGDPKDENFHFCGKKIKTGQTYCDEHSAIAYVKPLKK